MTENISPVPNITDEYAAGFFDGEGSVTIHHATRKSSKYVHHTLQVTINNTDESVMTALKNKYGGYLLKNPLKEGKRQFYTWTLRDSSSKEFLTAILPFSIVKRPNIEIALEYIGTIIKQEKGKKKQYVTQELWEKREALVERLSHFNYKGKERKKVTFYEYVEG